MFPLFSAVAAFVALFAGYAFIERATTFLSNKTLPRRYLWSRAAGPALAGSLLTALGFRLLSPLPLLVVLAITLGTSLLCSTIGRPVAVRITTTGSRVYWTLRGMHISGRRN